MRTAESTILVYRFEHPSLLKLLDDVRDFLFDDQGMIVYDIRIEMDSKEKPYCAALVYIMGTD